MAKEQQRSQKEDKLFGEEVPYPCFYLKKQYSQYRLEWPYLCKHQGNKQRCEGTIHIESRASFP